MKQTLLILGAAAFAIAAPAAAKPGHAPGQAKGHGEHKAAKAKGKAAKPASSRYYGYGRGACPPGLARKNELCLPPGQYKKLYRVGQRFPGNYGSIWSYDQIPYDLRNRYRFNPNDRYYYGDGYLYQVDPRTHLIREVVNAIIR